MLPKDMEEDLILKMGNFNDYLSLREHVRSKCELLMFVKSKSQGVHHVNTDRGECEQADIVEVDPDIGDEVLALLNKTGQSLNKKVRSESWKPSPGCT